MGTLSCPHKQGLGSLSQNSLGEKWIQPPRIPFSWLPETKCHCIVRLLPVSLSVSEPLGLAQLWKPCWKGRGRKRLGSTGLWCRSWCRLVRNQRGFGVELEAAELGPPGWGPPDPAFFLLFLDPSFMDQFSWASDQLLLMRLCCRPQKELP